MAVSVLLLLGVLLQSCGVPQEQNTADVLSETALPNTAVDPAAVEALPTIATTSTLAPNPQSADTDYTPSSVQFSDPPPTLIASPTVATTPLAEAPIDDAAIAEAPIDDAAIPLLEATITDTAIPVPPTEPTVLPSGDERAVPPASFPSTEIDAIFNSVPGTVAAIVYDVNDDQILYQRNADQSFYSASLMKVPIVLTMYDLIEQGLLTGDANSTLIMNADDIVPGTGSIQYDPPGTAYTLQQLGYVTIAQSDNTASNMLLVYVSGGTIDPVNNPVNVLVRRIGASQTIVQRRFFDEPARLAGLDIRTTPADMMLVLRDVIARANRGQVSGLNVLSAMRDNYDVTKLRAFLPAESDAANKSGVVGGIEHDMAIITTPTGRQYIMVVMAGDLTNPAAAINAMGETSSIVYNYQSQR